jgi:catechol 1,2-dioxygenase
VQALVRHLHDFAREVRLTDAEFDASINVVARLGQLTTTSHNEVRLMAGTLGLSTLVCLMNNGTEEQPTSANLLGPFWRKGAPTMDNGDSIIRSPTEGPPLFFTGTVVGTDGRPVPGAEIDVWHASPIGLYENQDPDQAEWNLRGKFYTDDEGMFSFRSVKPSGYPVPMGGPVGDLLTALKRHPFRPAHIHAMVYKPGYKTITSQLYSHDDPMLDTDAQFGVTRALVGTYVRHEPGEEPAPDVTEPWYTLDYTFVVEPGEAWLPTPPVSEKSETQVEGQIEAAARARAKAETKLENALPGDAAGRAGCDLTPEGMQAWIYDYFAACNSGDVERIAGFFEPDGVHYFPPGMYEGPFRGADTIGKRWHAAVHNGGSYWTVDQMITDPATRRAVIEWTHFKRKAGVMLRGDEWYKFSERGLIQEIRAYYASPQDTGLQVLEIAGYDYAGLGYPVSAPPLDES